jgi:hypothetical protein
LLNCAANAPVTVNSGDNDGYEVNPANACTSGAGVAQDNQSGTSDIAACNDPGKDRHLFWNYGASIPAGSTIDGVVVRLDAFADNSGNSPAMCVELSWDGGITWSAAQTTPLLGTPQTTYLLGSPTDTWGHVWTPTELADGSLVVRVTDIAIKTDRKFSLDWVAVDITYTH